jgi:chemotaxis protein MotB
MARRKPVEVHVNHERWLVSYADFITLLFAFFVVMYSISQVNQSKYEALSETFDQAFNSAKPAKPGKDSAAQVINPFELGEPSLNLDPSVIDLEGQPAQEIVQPVDEFEELFNLFSARFADLIDEDLMVITSNEFWLQVELKDSILFTSGDAAPSLQAQVIFDEIASIVKAYPNPIQVEGFTDNVPIKSALYPSNWELSSARASAIVKWLVNKGVEASRLSAVGYAEFQPIASNDSAEGRALNRRVALVIGRQSSARPMRTLTQ